MDNNEKEAMSEKIEKLDKQNQKYRKRMSRQTLMTVCMICVSIFVIAVATYAWYLITNTPKVTEMEFKADTVGDLLISNKADEDYTTAIALEHDDLNLNKYLSPVTTKDGKTFYRPLYNEGKVVDVKLLDVTDNEDKNLLYTKYVYERTFYLKAGNDSVSVAEAPKYYDICLVGATSMAEDSSSGSYMYVKETDGTTTSATMPTDNNEGTEKHTIFNRIL